MGVDRDPCTLLHLFDVLLKSVATHLFNLSIDYTLWKLAEWKHRWNPWIFKLVKNQSFFPKIIEKVKFFQLDVVMHNEDIKYVYFAFLEDWAGLQPISVIGAEESHIVLT